MAKADHQPVPELGPEFWYDLEATLRNVDLEAIKEQLSAARKRRLRRESSRFEGVRNLFGTKSDKYRY